MRSSPICGCISHDGFLTRRGYQSLRAPEVDKAEASLYLDKVGSVSAVRRDEAMVIFDDEVLEEQYRRFLGDVAV